MSNSSLNQAIKSNQVPFTKSVDQQAFRPLETVGAMTSYTGNSVSQKPVLTLDYQAYITGQTRNLYTWTLTPAVSGNILTTSSISTVTIPKLTAEQIRSMRLDIFVNETGGANTVSICPPMLAIQRIDFINQEGATIETWYGETMLFALNMYLNYNQFQLLAPLAGLTTAWAASSGCTIAANGYQQFSIPLYGFVDNAHPIGNLLDGTIQMKIYTRNAVLSGSAGGVLNVNKMNLVFEHNDLSDSNMAYKQSLYSSNVLKYRYLDKINTSWTGTLTHSARTTISLQNLNCYVAFGFVVIRSSLATANGYNTFASITAAQAEQTQGLIGILDGSGTDILNKGNQLSYNDINYIASQYFENTLTNVAGIYPIIFSGSIKRALQGDASTGGFMFVGGNPYQLAITPDATFASSGFGTYTVDAYWWYYKDLYIDNGRIKVNSYA